MTHHSAYLLAIFFCLIQISCSDNGKDAGTLYKEGSAEYEAGHLTDALSHALESLRKAELTHDTLLSARSHELIADCYRDVYNLKAARRHRALAIGHYLSSGRTDNAFYAYVDMAGEYTHDLPDSAYVMMDKALQLIDHDNADTRMQYELLYSDICRVNGDYAAALSHIRSLPQSWRVDNLMAEDSTHFGEIYYHCSMPDSATAYFANSSARDDMGYWECMTDLNERRGDLNAALACHKTLRDLGYAKTGVSLSNALESVESSFFEKRSAEEADKVRSLKSMIWIILASTVAIFAAIIAHAYYRRARSLKIENEIKDVALLSNEAQLEPQTPSESPISQTEEDVPDKWAYLLLDFHMSRLNEISREYFKTADEESMKKIETEFSRELRLLRGGEIFDEMEKRLNDSHDGICRIIRKRFPKFSEQYVRLMLCHLARLSSQSACLLLSMSKGNYYVAWTRIRARIRELPQPELEIFAPLFLKK